METIQEYYQASRFRDALATFFIKHLYQHAVPGFGSLAEKLHASKPILVHKRKHMFSKPFVKQRREYWAGDVACL